MVNQENDLEGVGEEKGDLSIKCVESEILPHQIVGKSWLRHPEKRSQAQKARFDWALQRIGKRAAEVYKELSIDKADWSRIVWNITTPDKIMQIKIAKKLECDTSNLWSDVNDLKGGNYEDENI